MPPRKRIQPEIPEALKGVRIDNALTTILDEAKEIVFGDRQHDYGETASSFQRIAELWGPVLGCPVSAEQVALCLIQLKVARAVNQHSADDEHEGLIKRDTIVDIAGYAQCLAMVQSNP